MISVVVPAYNAEGSIGACLDALKSQSVPREEYEILVVDDGSTDATAQVARDRGIRVVTQKHQGPAAARNHGAGLVSGDLLLFTDADCVPEFRWVEEMARGFRDPKVVAAKGAYRTGQSGLVPRFVQLEYADKYDRLLERQHSIDFVDSYSAGYRRQVLLASGGFDASFRTACVEDAELSFRLAEAGHRMVFLPEALVYHTHPESAAAYARRKFWIGYHRVPVHWRHPRKLVSDSRTPLSLRLQLILLPLVLLFLAGIPVRSELSSAFAICLLALIVTTVPFMTKALRRDPPVALVAVPLLLLRCLALDAGAAVGFIAFIFRTLGGRV